MSTTSFWPFIRDEEPLDGELEVVEAVQEFWYLVKPEPWMKDAACKGKDPDLFFLKQGQSARLAKEICLTCPVIAPCRVYAEETDSEGVWGGDLRSGVKRPGIQDARPQVISIEKRRTASPTEHPGFGTIAARRTTQP